MKIRKHNLHHVLEHICEKSKMKFNKMTQREKEIMVLVVNGNSSQEISKLLSISKNTVSTHRKNISKKTKLKSPKDYVLFALAFDLL